MNKKSFAYIVPAVLLMFASACNWGIDGVEMLDKKWPIEDGDAEPEEEIEAVELENIEGDTLAGQWIMMMEFNANIDVLGLHPIVIRDLFLVDINEEQTRAELTFCDQIQKITDGLTIGATENPQVLKDALGETPIVLEISENGTPAQKIAWLWGLKDVEDPFEDPIPMSPADIDDPRLWDQDRDGNPAVSVHVLGPKGYRYMVRRAIWDMSSGALSEDGQWIEGTANITVEQGAVAAVDESGKPFNTLTTAAPITDDTEITNPFRLRRVEGYDCEKLISNYRGIFLAGEEGAQE